MKGIDNVWLQAEDGNLVRFEGDKSYGFDVDGWYTTFTKDYNNYSIASPDVVEKRLSEYFMSKLPDGVHHKALRVITEDDTNIFKTAIGGELIDVVASDCFEYNSKKDILINYGRGLGIVYEKGRWCFNEQDRAYYENFVSIEVPLKATDYNVHLFTEDYLGIQGLSGGVSVDAIDYGICIDPIEFEKLRNPYGIVREFAGKCTIERFKRGDMAIKPFDTKDEIKKRIAKEIFDLGSAFVFMPASKFRYYEPHTLFNYQMRDSVEQLPPKIKYIIDLENIILTNQKQSKNEQSTAVNDNVSERSPRSEQSISLGRCGDGFIPQSRKSDTRSITIGTGTRPKGKGIHTTRKPARLVNI